MQPSVTLPRRLTLLAAAMLLATACLAQVNVDANSTITSYSTLKAAFDAINSGTHTGDIVITITSSTTETVMASLAASGTGSANYTRLLIKPTAIASVTGGLTTALVELKDADNVVIDGRIDTTGSSRDLTFNNTNSGSGSHTIRLIDGASNNTIRYCIIQNGGATTAGNRGIEIGTSASNPGGNSNNLITNCRFLGGRSGIALSGTSANPNLNNTISHCSIEDFGFAGVWILGSSNNTTIEYCSMFNTTAGVSSANSGINVGSVGGTNTIRFNKLYSIQNTSSTTVRGITLSPSAGSVWNIENNFISLTENNGTKTSIYAIQTSGTTDYTANIYYNTMLLSGTHTGGSAGSVVSGGVVKSNTGAASVFNLKNNICINTRSGGTSGVFHVGFFVGSTAVVGTLGINYNDWFANAPSAGYSAGWSGTLYADTASYRAAATPHESNTIFKNLTFVSSTDLHLSGPSIGDTDLKGTPIGTITVDIDGHSRDGSAPYMGADERPEAPLPVQLASLTARVNPQGAGVRLDWRTISEVNNFGFYVQRKREGDAEFTELANSFVPGNGTTSQPRDYVFIDATITQAGLYHYRLRQVDLDGTSHLTDPVSVAISSVTGVVEPAPREFSLHQNYPNPFNPSTEIKFSVENTGRATLEVFNLLGQKVATLFDDMADAGRYYRVRVNATNFASGMYIYRLQSGSRVDVKKMLLMK